MSDYSISSRLKIESNLPQVRRELWSLAREWSAFSKGVKASDPFRGIASSIRAASRAVSQESRRMKSDLATVIGPIDRLQRMQGKAAIAGARSSLGRANYAVGGMTDSMRIIDAQIAALARSPKSTAPADEGGGGMAAIIGGNFGAGVLLRAVDLVTGAVSRLAGGLRDSANDAFAYNKRLEVTQKGITSLYMASGEAQGNAVAHAAATTRTLRRMAAEGIGGLEDYTKAYSQLYTPLKQEGRTDAQIERFTRLTIAAGGALESKLGIRTAPIDVLQAMSRGATEAQTRILTKVLRGGGVDPSAFNKLGRSEKLDALENALMKWEPAAILMGQTIGSLEETHKDWLYLIGGEAVRGAGEEYRRSLIKQIDIMKVNEREMTTFAEIIGVTGRSLYGIIADIQTGAMQAAEVMANDPTVTTAWYHTAGGGAEQLRTELDQLAEGYTSFTNMMSTKTAQLVGFVTRLGATIAYASRHVSPWMFVGGVGRRAAADYDPGELWRIWNAGPSFDMEQDAAGGMGDGSMLQAGPSPERLGSAIGKSIARHQKPLDVRFRVDVEWGDPRSLAMSLERALNDAAARGNTYAASSSATPAFAGAR